MFSRRVALAQGEDLLAHDAGALEVGLDQAAGADAEMPREVIRQRRFAERGEAGELALVPPHAEAAGQGRKAVGGGEAVMAGAPLGQQPVVAIGEVEAAVAKRADRIADVVANSIGRVDQRIVPIGVEQRSSACAS